MSSEVTAELIEETFGKRPDSARFANFCNSIVIADSAASAPTIAILSEKPGADGGIDGEWEIPRDFKTPFGLPGWSVFQYKARSIAGAGRQQAISKLSTNLNGALAKLIGRLPHPKECSQYSLFTNLQLGLETTTATGDGKLINKQRNEIARLISIGSDGKTPIKIFDAGQLAAIVNAHPALKLTYFSGQVARSWNDAWSAEEHVKDYKVSVPLVGRNKELDQIAAWLRDDDTKVIVLCGPSGMGKTRLALEATRPFALSTTLVEVVDDLLRADFETYGTSKVPRLIIVEDPSREQAEALAKRSVSCEGVKLILTVPTDAKAPALKLTEHRAVKNLPPLQALNNSDAESLLKAAGASFDRQALDWILLQAGGNPEILLSAAELKDELREKSGDLKKRLHERFRAKIEKELGLDAIRALKALSPVLYVKYQGDNSELKLVCDSLNLGIEPSRVLELLPDLERMGYIRRRGNYVCVIPPLFAARLVEELASNQEDSIRRLFNNLEKAPRGRFLERMVTVDLPEKSAFWDYIFSDKGPLEVSNKIHFDNIESLARAVPGRTARFLEGKLTSEASSEWQGHYCLSTLRELAYEGESCASGMRCLELLALNEIGRANTVKETKLFCECFVDWYYQFPMSYQERSAWVEHLVKSEDRARRLLGAHIVAFVTDVPHMLSGYAGGTARRLGQPPPRRLWKDIHEYMARLVELRFDLTQSEDRSIAEIVRNGFEESTARLKGHVLPDQLVTIMERMVEWHFNGKLPIDVRKMRSAIHWAEERYTESSQVSEQKSDADKLKVVLKRIADLRERFDDGDFLLRLKIATGNSVGFGWEEGEEGRIYGYQKRLRSLALEVTENPELMTDSAWSVAIDEQSVHAWELIRFIGQFDKRRHFLSRFEAEIGGRAGNWRYAHYCFGLHGADPEFVEEYLDLRCANPGTSGPSLLKVIDFIGPTLTNRRRLLKLIADKVVSPIDVSETIFGRWLDNLPTAEATTALDFISQGDQWQERLAHILNQYLYSEKLLPKEFIPFAERTLQQIEPTYDKSHECDHIALGIAKTDLEKGFDLLRKQVDVLNKMTLTTWRVVWNPFQRYRGSDFWDFLRSEDPERAYRTFFLLRNRDVLQNDIFGDKNSLLDLENHSAILLKIAAEHEDSAEQIAGIVMISQPGFFPFAFKLLSGKSLEGKVASLLSSTTIGGFGSGTPLERERVALGCVEAQLKETNLSSHNREWLEQLRRDIQEAIKGSPWNFMDEEHLGWT